LFLAIFFKGNILSYKYTNIYIGFFGLTLITFISHLTNIFFAHNFAHNIILHSVGIFFLFYFEKKYLKFYKAIFFISIFVVISLFIFNITPAGLVLYKPAGKNGDLDYYWEIPSLCSGD
jgi:hypothetical protein